MDKTFHTECYKCEDCHLQLSSEGGRACYPLDGHLLCQACNTKRLTNPNPPVSDPPAGPKVPAFDSTAGLEPPASEAPAEPEVPASDSPAELEAPAFQAPVGQTPLATPSNVVDFDIEEEASLPPPPPGMDFLILVY